MKIEKIIIQNLNSIENAEINFSDGVLAKEPIFLICGETGSGKTTILDAITLALYDKASRYELVNNNEKTENGVTTKNTVNILRKGKKEAKAELYFSVNDVSYIATWYVRKTKTDSYDTSNRRKLEIVDGEMRTVISNNIGEVNKKIEELVGLSYEQFIRSVMLAQGEFSTFLKSKKIEQSEILEMLTGTEVYSKIAEAVKTKKGEAFYKRKEVETLYNNLKDKVLSQEEVAGFDARQEELTLKISHKENELKKMESAIAWFKRNDELRKECEEFKSLCDNVLEQINSGEYADNQAIINDYFRTSKEREALRELQRLEAESLKINRYYYDDIRCYLNLNNSLENEKSNKEKLLILSDGLKNWLENHRDNEIVSDNLNLILSALNESSQIYDILVLKEKELNDGELKKSEIASQLELLTQTFEDVKKYKQEAEIHLEKLLSNFNYDEYKKLIEEQQQLDFERKSYSDRNAKLSAVRTVLEQYLELSKIIKNEKDKCEDLKLLLNQKNEELSLSKSAFEIKDSEFQKQKDMVEDWAKEYRSKLKDGEPCPVCGSKEHYFKDENVVRSLFASIEKEWGKLKTSYEKVKDDVNKTEAELNAVLRNINTEEKRSVLLLNNLNSLCNGNPIFEIERIDVNIKKYNDLIANIDKRIVEISERLNGFAIVKKNIDEAQKNKKLIDDKYNSAEKRISAKQLEYQQLELSLNTVKTIIQEQKTKLVEKENYLDEFVKIADWKQLLSKAPEDLAIYIKGVAYEWKSKNESLKNTDNQILNLTDVIAQCEKYVLNVSKLIPDVNLEFEKRKVEIDELIPSFSVVYDKIKARLSEKNRIEEDLNSVRLIIDNFILNNADITFERLKFVSEINDIQCFVQKNKDLDDELIKSKNTLTIKTEALESHQNDDSKPKDGVSLEELELSLISLTNEKKMEEESLADVKMRLALNKQNSTDSIECQRDLEEKDAAYRLWEQLAKAIGTTDKDNFRDVAQAYTMGILLDRANYYMGQLSSRYKLYNYPDSLAIMVQDMEMGAELRTASSLSGGETFLVSLALALGLTSLNDQHFNMDMIFIDEGFGTLDNESLDMVMNTLENLHNLGKRVGIISHVDTLKERIPAKIQLIREGKSASRVEVVRN